MARPQTIQIFLPDGSPRGIKIAELTNRVVKAILIPRNQLDNAGKRKEVGDVGCYFLFGEDENSAKPMVYIGEAENCLKRLKKHNREKEFWTHAVVFVSRIGAFTKAHAKYMEHLGLKKAKEVNRYNLFNPNNSAKPFVTESMEADLLDSFETVTVLLSTLGYPIFDSISKKAVAKKELFFINAKGIKAEGDLIDDGFVVFKDSEATIKATPSCHQFIINARQQLVKDNILMEQNGKYIFKEDHVFSSPSTAAGVVQGRAANGWVDWKDKNGKTLNELKRQ